jgi:hypothetical protein
VFCLQVRDAFRRYMAQAPDAWDYTVSDIPSPLTDEMEAAQQSKKVCAVEIKGRVRMDLAVGAVQGQVGGWEAEAVCERGRRNRCANCLLYS